MIAFHGFLIEESAMVIDLAEKSIRNIEVYGDSVSAGEVSEAIDYCGQPDPEHNGEYSNSYYSYAWFLSRKLNANLHNIAQGGIALLDNTGYFMEPKALGIPAIFDKIQYQPVLCKPKEWDFKQYTPQVVIVAIGQNDSHPIDFMAIDHNSEQARVWKKSYEEFLNKLREIYPHSHIICKTTILEHDMSWYRAIDRKSVV